MRAFGQASCATQITRSGATPGLQLYVYGIEGGLSSVGAWWPDLMHWTTDWTVPAFGGIGGVRLVHHFMLYPIVGWALLHIYYEIWRTVMWKEADINIMFGGHKFARQPTEVSREQP